MVQGVAVPWDSLSSVLWTDGRTGKPVRERFKRGAFADALSDPGLDVLALRDHDSRRLLGRTSSGTLEVRETERGLEYELDVPDTNEGRDLLVQIGRGDISGSSFAFWVGEAGVEWSEEEEQIVRTITTVAGLDDVSPVVRPAYPESSVAMRGLDEMRQELDDWRGPEAPPQKDAEEIEAELVSAGL